MVGRQSAMMSTKTILDLYKAHPKVSKSAIISTKIILDLCKAHANISRKILEGPVS